MLYSSKDWENNGGIEAAVLSYARSLKISLCNLCSLRQAPRNHRNPNRIWILQMDISYSRSECTKAIWLRILSVSSETFHKMNTFEEGSCACSVDRLYMVAECAVAEEDKVERKYTKGIQWATTIRWGLLVQSLCPDYCARGLLSQKNNPANTTQTHRVILPSMESIQQQYIRICESLFTALHLINRLDPPRGVTG